MRDTKGMFHAKMGTIKYRNNKVKIKDRYGPNRRIRYYEEVTIIH